MHRLLLVVVAVALALAGCGSSTPAASSPDPIAGELSYFSAQSPFVMTLATKPTAQAQAGTHALQSKFPFLALARTAAIARLEQLGIDYQRDIKPLLQNPIALGAAGTSLSASKTQFLFAWVTNNAGKLSALISKLHGLRSAGTYDGAKLYQASSGAAALDGGTVLFARSLADVTAGLDRHAHQQGISARRYAAATAGLDTSVTIKVFGDLTGVLSTAKTATARRVPWVAALRSYGASVSAGSGGVTVRFRLDTGGRPLTTAQLPIVAGDTSPSLVQGLPIQVGIRDPAQIAGFIASAEQLTSPQKYAKFVRQQATLRRKSGVDVSSLLSRLSGDLVIDSDTQQTLVRAGVGDHAAAASVLAKLASVPNGLGTKTPLKPIGGGVYSFSVSHREGLIGVVGNQLVVGVPPRGVHPTARALHLFAAAPGVPTAGARGAVSFRVQLPTLLALTLRQPVSPAVQQLLALLGDVTGSMSAGPSALTGSATLALR